VDLCGGACTMSFAVSSAEVWGGFTLTITNYALGTTKLRFGTSSSGLTPGQLAQMQFADFLNLPGAIDTAGYVSPNLPKITALTNAGASVQLSWTAVNGRTYRVWAKDTLGPDAWNDLGDVTASGDTASTTDSAPSATGRYYRVEVRP